ncbi:ethanolamine utilization protein EutP [Peptoniphilus sp. AGMB00490]|uniref:Ethanolamine utilization protein EutP n=1 Tax=Peptoniphilus faecalis TaxID=2731255 RepID=A0A848RIQ4_9FIRM|nr:EutP/PduV family microcompartment system protein [Peptoniphilus faecalis]NMW85323.1 ethanolamine utilization protein EutP [Peptoniphilus faecalis]
MKRKWVIVGKNNSGKTKLADFIEKDSNNKKVSLDLYYRDKTIEIPGEYLEMNYLNNAIIMISQNQALGTLFVVSADDEFIYPPNFAKSFTRICATVITKIDLVEEIKLKEIHEKALEIGTENIFLVSNKTHEGLDELEEFIKGCED